METRKRDKLFNFEVGEECFTLYKQGPLDLTKSAQIPTYRYLLERWFTLQLEYRRSEVLRILSAEHRNEHCYNELSSDAKTCEKCV